MLAATTWEVGDRNMRLTTDLPCEVHSLTYVKNSHFIKLEDDDGNSTKLDASSVVKYTCEKCGFLFLTFENHGDITCPSCAEQGAAKPVWYVPQLSFVPEQASNFTGGFKIAKGKKKA
jgi:DNA-directed RNA polymerase subunit RPC12/RpoP